MISFAGSKGSLKLFVDDKNAVVIDSSLNLVVGTGDASVLLSAREWDKPEGSVDAATLELASGAVTTLDIKVITAAAGRGYSIPDGVKAEAKKALEWHKEHKRGGTPVGLNTARTLAKGGQIGIEKIRHIAKYFPRHEVDKKGKGWKPGQDEFPSNGRIAWALWGGDGAWRWAQAIVERENKKSVTATGYVVPGYSDSVDTYRMADAYDSDLDAFKSVNDLDPNYGPEFMARVRMDGSGIDRLYKVDINGKVCVWDDGRWDDLGHVDGDVWTYDSALDDAYDHCEKDHFVIDPESAIYISARMMQDPHGTIAIEDLDPDEANLFAAAAGEEDWSMSDYAMAASGALVAFIGSDTGKDSKPKGAVKSGDGQYTSAERSSIATGAPRDATGKFAKAGGRAVVGGDRTRGAGVITGRSATPGNILFKSDVSGQVMDIPAKFTVPEAEAPQTAPAPTANPAQGAPLDVSGILGEPRMAKGSVGQLPGTMEQLTPEAIGQALNDWGSYVEQARASFTGKATDNEVRQYAKDTNQKIREVPTVTEGKATTLRDGKFVVQSVPSAPVSEDMNPDNAPAAAAPAARSGIGRASVPSVSGGDSAPTPAPSQTDRIKLKPQPAKPGEGKGVKTLPATPGKKAMPRTMPATKPAPAKKVPRNAAPEQTPRKPTPRNVPNVGKNPDRLTPSKPKPAAPKPVPRGAAPEQAPRVPTRNVPNAGKNPDRITPSKPRTPGKDAVERGTNGKGTNFVKSKPVPRGAAPEQKPRIPGKPSSSGIGRIDKAIPSAPKNGGKKIIGYEPLPGSPNMARPIYGDDKPTKTPIPWPKPAPDVEVSGPSNRPTKPKPTPKPEAPKPKPKPKPTPKPKPEPEKPKPEEPETPVTPEEPTEPPVTPEEPETPPTEPETPEEPTTPEEPVEPPVTPEEPKPEEPKKPAPPKKKPAPKPAPKPKPPVKKPPRGALPMPETDRNPGPKKGGDIVGYEPLPGSPNMARPIYGDLTKSIKNPNTGKTTPIQVSPGPDAVERGTNTKGTNFKKTDTKKDAVERGTNTKGTNFTKPKPKAVPRNVAPEQTPRVPTKRGKAGARKRTKPGTVGPIL